YDRWWCDAEKKYAPKEYGKTRNPCPTCGKELAYIKEYDRWYCHSEKKYAPKTYVAAPPTVTVTQTPTVVRAQQAVAAQPVAAPAAQAAVAEVTKAEHRHGKPTAGIVLAAIGFSLVIVWFLFLPVGPLATLGLIPLIGLGIQVSQILGIIAFIGLILAMAGVIAGLASVRSR
ncbi:MAG TPA: hypothetical protein VJ400_00165, partial [Thermoplasmata archaeon]|nr:hypothetical protein [Thermoplasmata archaeon]